MSSIKSDVISLTPEGSKVPKFQSKLSFWPPMVNIKPTERRILPKLSAKKTDCASFSNTKTSTLKKAVSILNFLPPVTKQLVSTTSTKISASLNSFSKSCESSGSSSTTITTSTACTHDELVSGGQCSKSSDKFIYDLGASQKTLCFDTIDEANLISENNNLTCNTDSSSKIISNYDIANMLKKDLSKDFSWLCYSPSLDGGFCLACVLFGSKFPSKFKKITKLYSKPVNYWPDAYNTFKNHESSSVKGLHAETSLFFTEFLHQMSGVSKPLNVMVDTQLQQKLSANRKKLIPIVDTVVTLGRNSIAFRGSRDDI